jgi:hypothetical protein
MLALEGLGELAYQQGDLAGGGALLTPTARWRLIRSHRDGGPLGDLPGISGISRFALTAPRLTSTGAPSSFGPSSAVPPSCSAGPLRSPHREPSRRSDRLALLEAPPVPMRAPSLARVIRRPWMNQRLGLPSGCWGFCSLWTATLSAPSRLQSVAPGDRLPALPRRHSAVGGIDPGCLPRPPAERANYSLVTCRE